MDEDLVKLENFNKFLNEIQTRTNKAATVTTARMEMILKLDELTFDRAIYDKFFDSASETDSKDTAYISKLTETKEK